MLRIKCQRIKVVSIAVFCSILTSCSNNYSAFFQERDTQLAKGYVWVELNPCRPPQLGSQSITVLNLKGDQVVCYTLSPPSKQISSTSPTDLTYTDSLKPLTKAQAVTNDSKVRISGVTWQFSNFSRSTVAEMPTLQN